MEKAKGANIVVKVGSVVVAFAATMIAMWAFSHDRIVWGGYNIAIAIVAIAVVAATRAHEQA